MYDTARRVLYEHQLQSKHPNNVVFARQPKDYLYYDNLSNVAMASFMSGSLLSVITSPMVVVKTKQQIAVWGFRKAITETFVNGGLQGFYAAFGAHFICESFGRSFYMFAYELSKRQVAQSKISGQSLLDSTCRTTTENISTIERMLCAALAGMSSWALIFPFDVIKSKLYARTLTKQASTTALDGLALARQLVREQGIRSLYRGIGVTVARGGPVAATVLPVYDYVLAWESSSR
jgi:ornithine carrier protein